MLHEAADAGDSTAAAALGDYYFEKGGSSNWTKAYEYYTGYGAIALNKNRKKAIVSILNHKLYNRKILGLCVILFFAFVATVIWAPATAVFAACPFWGWLAVAVQLTLLVLSILHYRSKPYDCVYTLRLQCLRFGLCIWQSDCCSNRGLLWLILKPKPWKQPRERLRGLHLQKEQTCFSLP